MPNVVKLLRSTMPGASPSSLVSGQIAINEADGKLFWLDANGVTIRSATIKDLDTIVSTKLSASNNLADLNNSATARANLNVPSNTGLGASGTWTINITGTAAFADNATYATAAGDAAKLSGVTPVSFGLARLADANAVTARANLGLGSISTRSATDFALVGHTHPVSAGAWVLLSTITAANSAALQATNVFADAAYDSFVMMLDRIIPTQNSGCYMQVYADGAFKTASYSYCQVISSNSTDQIGQSFIKIGWQNNENTANALAGGHSMIMHVQRPQDTTGYKTFFGHGSYGSTDSNKPKVITVTGLWQGGQSAITGFQVYFSAGNVASGQIRVYGVKK